MERIDYVDQSHPEVKKLIDWFETLTPHSRSHELGTIAALFELALDGRLVFTNDAKSKIEAIRSDPDLFEIRHKALSKKLRFYHAEPTKYPNSILSLHEHIKVGNSHQQRQIDFAVERYRKKA